MTKPFAEITESSLLTATGQSWQWDTPPAFGSLVSIDTGTSTLIGVVSHIQTGSHDPLRYPFTYQKTEAELRAEQPQIFEFLRTTFTINMVGCTRDEKLFFVTPSHPAKIHSFISPCSQALTERFFSTPAFLGMLWNHQTNIQNFDELLLALMINHWELTFARKQFIVELFEQFSLLTGNDYRRLKLLLARVEQFRV